MEDDLVELNEIQRSEIISISMTRQRYFDLLNDSDQFRLLENGGVDNWENMSNALHDDPDDNINLCREGNLEEVMKYPTNQ